MYRITISGVNKVKLKKNITIWIEDEISAQPGRLSSLLLCCCVS